MLISEIPDDCWLTIFDYLNNLDDLINCYKVCIKWSHLIAKRAKKVKYLIDIFLKRRYGYTANHNCVYFDNRRKTEMFDGTCLSTLFQNLIIIEMSYNFHRKVKREDIVALVKNQKSLKGLTGEYYEFLSEYCDNLEMINRDFFEASIQHNGSSIKQLYHTAHFQKDAHYVPNLERLNFEGSSQCYDGPVLEKLKIVELWTAPESWGSRLDYSSKFMDFCPNLQSAHLRVGSNRFFVDETIKNECLQDLVLDAVRVGLKNLNDLIRLLMKYPNLKHLSLRRASNLKDEHIEQIVHILPNLVLFDVNECLRVTQRAADYVQNHCKRHGRSIKFYFYENRHEIESDWPQLSTKKEKICRGFDFMKHCFLKNFSDLPYFLIPIDY